MLIEYLLKKKTLIYNFFILYYTKIDRIDEKLTSNTWEKLEDKVNVDIRKNRNIIKIIARH